jgi:hypothetical protein
MVASPELRNKTLFDTVRVDSGEPQTPQTGDTARQARIKELTETNAKRRIWSTKKIRHAHGRQTWSEVDDTKMSRRSIDGKDPITGKIPEKQNGSPSSQFNSWKLQLQAWTKATSRTERGLPSYTGIDDNKTI